MSGKAAAIEVLCLRLAADPIALRRTRKQDSILRRAWKGDRERQIPSVRSRPLQPARWRSQP